MTEKPVQNGTNLSQATNTAKNVISAGSALYAAYNALTSQRPTTSGILGESEVRFPLDLIAPDSNRNYYISFRFSQYRRRSIFDLTAFTPTGGSIILPIPNNLIDTQAVNWDNAESDPAVGAGIEAALGGKGPSSVASGVVEGIGLTAINKAASTAGSFVGQTLPVEQALQMAGFAQNPFLTVLFKSPAFKTHTFSWKMAPNNQSESNAVRNIINMFRRHMLPSLAPSTGGTLLTYPDIVEVNLYPNEDYLYKFKPCVVESMSVNFAPSSTPSFFKRSNAPTEIQLSVNLKEIEYWLQDDVDNFYSASNLSRQL
jgi:hypothetical protein